MAIKSPPERILLTVVLFSIADKSWKVADFGLTTEGTSKRMRSTIYGRGTACYRAPELVKEDSEYSNKVDIFALGCIMFELVTEGKKAFKDDFSVREYSLLYNSHPHTTLNKTTNGRPPEFLLILSALLAVVPSMRPNARQLQKEFALNRCLSLGHFYLAERKFDIAIEAFKEATGYHQNDHYTWRTLGFLYRVCRRYPEAVDAYRKAIAAGFTESSIYSDLAEALCSDGRQRASIESYRMALQMEPNNTYLLCRMGDAYASITGHANVVRSFEMSQQHIANDPELYLRIETYYSAKQDDVEQQNGSGALDANLSGFIGENNSLGTTVKPETDQMKGMESHCKLQGDEHPDTLSTMQNLAVTYHTQSRITEGWELLVRVLEIRRRILGSEDLNTLKTLEAFNSNNKGKMGMQIWVPGWQDEEAGLDRVLNFLYSHMLTLPVHDMRFTRVIEDKRRRAASSSARFRKRKKEQEEENLQEISRLEKKIDDLKREFVLLLLKI